MKVEGLKAEVEAFWRGDYAAPFLAKDAEAYADAFALPCLIRAENLGRRSFTERAELLRYCTAMIAAAEATSWDSSTIDSFVADLFDEEVATVRVVASRFDAQGTRLARLYGNYTLNKEDGTWKMVAIFGGFLND
jgi:hypothetical protein